MSDPALLHPTPDDPVQRLLAVAREILSRPGIAADDVLTEHGGTSLSIVRILAVADLTLGLDIDLHDLTGALTVRNLAGAAGVRQPGPA